MVAEPAREAGGSTRPAGRTDSSTGMIEALGGGAKAMVDETHRYVDKSVEAANAQNDARFTKASSDVRDVQAELSVTKTELGAKVDGVKAQVDSVKTEMVAKFDGVNAQFDGVNAKFDGVNAQLDGVNKKLDGINPLKGWHILATLVACLTLAFTFAYATFAHFGNANSSSASREDIAALIAEAFVQSGANGSLIPRPEVVPEIQEPEDSGPGLLQNEGQQ